MPVPSMCRSARCSHSTRPPTRIGCSNAATSSARSSSPSTTSRKTSKKSPNRRRSSDGCSEALVFELGHPHAEVRQFVLVQEFARARKELALFFLDVLFDHLAQHFELWAIRFVGGVDRFEIADDFLDQRVLLVRLQHEIAFFFVTALRAFFDRRVKDRLFDFRMDGQFLTDLIADTLELRRRAIREVVSLCE